MPTIGNGSSVALTVTSNQQILLNCAPGVRCDVVATSGVPGSSTARKLATHTGGNAVYGPFGDGSVTLFSSAAALVQSGSARAGSFYDLADELMTYTAPVHL